jgi:hypothetical protein
MICFIDFASCNQTRSNQFLNFVKFTERF